MLAGRRADEGAATVVHLIMLMPLLTAALAAVMHLGLHLLSRQAATTAVQEGLTIVSGVDGTAAHGQAVATQIISDHSAAEILDLSTSTTATTVTMTATLRSPGIVPGLPRLLTISQTAVREQWIAP